MSTTYNIDFSEPIKQGFQIKAGAYNGPGGTESNTTLRLFGRGAREWGEAVDEDLVRLAENFASASAPSVAISGQMWVETAIYYRNTTIGNVLQGWYRYDTTTNTWGLLGGTGVVPNTAAPVPTVGSYYYDSGEGVLKGYYSLGKYEPAAWLTRASTANAGAPGALVPAQTLFVFNANENAGAGKWEPQSATIVTTGTTPGSPSVGLLWYNTADGNLSVWTGTAWQNVLGPTNSGGDSTSAGILNMNTFKITNLGAPTLNTDATTKQYVDGAVAAVSSSLSGYLPLTGGTLTGPGNLTINGHLSVGTGATVTGALIANTGLTVTGTTSATGYLSVGASAQISGSLTMLAGGTILMTGNVINNLGMDLSAGGAVNKSYADGLYNSAIAYADTKLAVVTTATPYLFGNGTGGNPLGVEINGVRAGVFSSLGCGEALAMRNIMIACGYWPTGGGGTGTIGPA